jgi:hypothetical protein
MDNNKARWSNEKTALQFQPEILGVFSIVAPDGKRCYRSLKNSINMSACAFGVNICEIPLRGDAFAEAFVDLF